jgi:uncharacterized membrane protein YdjX (TVP38/TMEM64 family)
MRRVHPIKKLLVVALIACTFIAFWTLGLERYLTLSYVKGSLGSLRAAYGHYPASVIACYFLIYVLVTSLSLPGAVVLTIAGGGLFGLVTGTIVVSFASAIGATLACFVSRYLLGAWVQKRFGSRIEKINEGIEREGVFYLFTLRLIPLFPFWLINLAMGLSRMRLRAFWWISQLGMLPGTIVYVNAGRELARIESARDILSPGLLVSFALIGIFPIAVKKLLALYRVNRRGEVGKGSAP